jgi:hypothetical protein
MSLVAVTAAPLPVNDKMVVVPLVGAPVGDQFVPKLQLPVAPIHVCAEATEASEATAPAARIIAERRVRKEPRF